MSDKNIPFILNDIMDAMDGIVRNLRDINPGARYGDIEFYLDRASKKLEEMTNPVTPAHRVEP